MTHQYLLDIIILFLTVYPLSWNYLYFFPVEKFSTYYYFRLSWKFSFTNLLISTRPQNYYSNCKKRASTTKSKRSFSTIPSVTYSKVNPINFNKPFEKFFKKKLFIHLKANLQENLEDQFVQEALNKGLDLRKYSKEIEKELYSLEKRSIKDCK